MLQSSAVAKHGANALIREVAFEMIFSSPMNVLLWIMSVVCLVPLNAFAWTNGELLIWMDNERGGALQPIVHKFETELGLKVTIETPEKITDSFPIAAQAGKGPDVVIWAHDKVG
jgi:maltose/maltodextrin transport system substrate-binding protein